jgi:hypothetical protein
MPDILKGLAVTLFIIAAWRVFFYRGAPKTSVVVPLHPIPRPRCWAHGFALVDCGDSLLLTDSRGNQCPWRGSGRRDACPCGMEIAKAEPNAEDCNLAHKARAKFNLSEITVWPHELPEGLPADKWAEYVMSDRCPRPIV